MQRRTLLAQLRRYGETWPEEAPCVQRFVRFVEAHPDCLLRACVPGHVTASAWIVDAAHERFLLTHHRKLNRWLQLGGHVDGEPRVALAALREAQEESGMEHFALPAGELEPIDLDIHPIPAHGREPAHFHYDVRFVLVAGAGQELRASEESHELRWFPVAEMESVTAEESVARLARKATRLLARLR
jgi:8-oxo-dGTP pyrophosphatase MutT (NUDIX family)